MPIRLTKHQLDVLFSANGQKNVKVLAREAGMSEKAVYSFCYRRKIPIKKISHGRANRECNNVHTVPEAKKEQCSIRRPPAVYTNHSPFGIAS